MRRIYLAAMYSQMPEMRIMRDTLAAMGYEITSRWIDGNEDGMSTEDAVKMDLDDIDRADTLVLFTQDPGTYYKGGGRMVEFGYAMAKEKTLVVVGGDENIFIHHPRVVKFYRESEFLEHMRSLAPKGEDA